MPAKVYLDSPPNGDFRAMPARGDGLALLKWITSFPGNPDRGLPTVMGVICLSDAATGAPLMLLDARSVTALRTGAAAAVASATLAPTDARTVGIVGCGLHGAWVARCLLAAGYGPGVCFDVDGARRRAPRRRDGPRLARRQPRGGGRAGGRLMRHAGRGGGDRRAGPPPRGTSEHARRRCSGQGGGDRRGGRRLRPVLRRVGAGLAWRRADGCGRCRTRLDARRSPSLARCSPATPPAVPIGCP